MSKYIVKNCPAYINMPLGRHDKVCRLQDITMHSDTELYRYCKNCTDCLIKQVIDDCKESIKHYENEGWKSDDCLKWCGEASMSFKLLQLFEIEECE